MVNNRGSWVIAVQPRQCALFRRGSCSGCRVCIVVNRGSSEHARPALGGRGRRGIPVACSQRCWNIGSQNCKLGDELRPQLRHPNHVSVCSESSMSQLQPTSRPSGCRPAGQTRSPPHISALAHLAFCRVSQKHHAKLPPLTLHAAAHTRESLFKTHCAVCSVRSGRPRGSPTPSSYLTRAFRETARRRGCDWRWRAITRSRSRRRGRNPRGRGACGAEHKVRWAEERRRGQLGTGRRAPQSPHSCPPRLLLSVPAYQPHFRDAASPPRLPCAHSRR